MADLNGIAWHTRRVKIVSLKRLRMMVGRNELRHDNWADCLHVAESE